MKTFVFFEFNNLPKRQNFFKDLVKGGKMSLPEAMSPEEQRKYSSDVFFSILNKLETKIEERNYLNK